MHKFEIITIPNPVLKKKSKTVSLFDQKLRQTVNNLYKTLYATGNGIGLAAPQVGILQRIVVIDIKENEKSKPLTMINPKILKKSLEKNVNQEGCLSIPGYYADVERSKTIKVEWFNEYGKKMIKDMDGLLSICVQHEVDHLEGILFTDYLSSLKRKMALEKVLKFNKNKKS